MKVTGTAVVQLTLDSLDFSEEAFQQIQQEIGEKSPARMLSEYIHRLLLQGHIPGTIIQVSAMPDRWVDD